MENEKKLALLMDFENLAIGIENNDPEEKKPFTMREILDYLEKNFGKVIYRKAFADWSNPKYRKYSTNLMRHGVEMQHIVRIGFNSRNSSGNHLVIHALDCLAQNPAIDAFVLVTGDADFLPLISHIQSKGKSVIGMGPAGAIANVLINNCDQFLSIAPDGIHPIQPNTIDRGYVIKTIQRLIGNTGMGIDNLDDQLQELIPEFNLEEFGCETLEEFLENAPNLFRLEENENGELMVNWNLSSGAYAPRGRYNSYRFSEMNNAGSLEDYLRATRWFISNGETREEILANLFNFLASNPGKAVNPDEMRDEVCRDVDVDDRSWQGTIYSLASGNALFECSKGMMPFPQRLYCLDKSIGTLDDFQHSYYRSLFHKALADRSDLNPESMCEMMFPESVDDHLAMFEEIFDEMKNGRK